MSRLVTLLIRVFLQDVHKPRYVSDDLVKETGLGAGKVYVALAQLKTAGWVTSCWDRAEPAASGRPRRRMYQLTPDGSDAARAELAEQGSRNTPRTHLIPALG